MQVQFYMMSPYVLKTLSHNDKVCVLAQLLILSIGLNVSSCTVSEKHLNEVDIMC